CFIRMQFQPELPQALPPVLEELLRIRSMLEPQHRVIRIADHDYFSRGLLRPPVLYPEVENIMQVDIREPRRDHRSLRSSHLRLRPFSILRNAGPQPFLD